MKKNWAPLPCPIVDIFTICHAAPNECRIKEPARTAALTELSTTYQNFHAIAVHVPRRVASAHLWLPPTSFGAAWTSIKRRSRPAATRNRRTKNNSVDPKKENNKSNELHIYTNTVPSATRLSARSTGNRVQIFNNVTQGDDGGRSENHSAIRDTHMGESVEQKARSEAGNGNWIAGTWQKRVGFNTRRR